MLLENKNAVVYGAGGPVGGAVARAFAREGARVFLAGRTQEPLDRLAEEIGRAGGRAEAGRVDVLDESSVDEHAGAIASKAGGIHVSFNSIGHGDVHGLPLLEMPYEDFFRPIQTAMRGLFLTARAAARHMIERGSGVILTITATTARMAVPNVGGTGVTFEAMQSLCRQWACELGPYGIRVAWLHTTGLPEALHAEVQPDYGTGRTPTNDEHIEWMKSKTMLGRLTSLADVGNAVTYLASDRAAPITASGLELTGGFVP